MANEAWDDALLADLRVVDLTDAYAAATGRVLADMGAEVVRVEVPGGGVGPTRAPRAADGTGLHHAFRNVGKVVVTLDPAAEGDRATADAVHEGRTSAQAAFMAGHLKVGGDVGALLAHQELLAELNDVLAHLRAAAG